MSVVVLLPIYDYETSYLQDQLRSLAGQTLSEFRCVVSHDGPLKQSQFANLSEFLPDNRFQLIEQSTHLGLYLHVERLISEYGIKSEFFVLCDQDDVWEPSRLNQQLKTCIEGGYSVVSDNAWIVDANLISVAQKTNFQWFRICEENVPMGLLLNQLTGASGIYRSQDFVKALPFPHDLGQGVCVHDHWLYLCAIMANGVFFNRECSWSYRQHDKNLIGASASSFFGTRLVRAVQKFLGIFKGAIADGIDPVIGQASEFQKALMHRYPNDLVESKLELLQRRRSTLSKMRLLVRGGKSNLESLRLLLN